MCCSGEVRGKCGCRGRLAQILGAGVSPTTETSVQAEWRVVCTRESASFEYKAGHILIIYIAILVRNWFTSAGPHATSLQPMFPSRNHWPYIEMDDMSSVFPLSRLLTDWPVFIQLARKLMKESGLFKCIFSTITRWRTCDQLEVMFRGYEDVVLQHPLALHRADFLFSFTDTTYSDQQTKQSRK
jgi:hypothetical protein